MHVVVPFRVLSSCVVDGNPSVNRLSCDSPIPECGRRSRCTTRYYRIYVCTSYTARVKTIIIPSRVNVHNLRERAFQGIPFTNNTSVYTTVATSSCRETHGLPVGLGVSGLRSRRRPWTTYRHNSVCVCLCVINTIIFVISY